MQIIKRMRKQKAVWWAVSSLNQYGAPTFSAPVEVSCRWDNINETFQDQKGEQKVSQSVVYVDREMDLGGYLQLGELDSNTPDDPTTSTDAFPIRQFNQIKTLRANKTLFIAYL